MERPHPDLSVSRQCALLHVPRSSAYYTPNTTESAENLALMRLIDEQYLCTPFYGYPRMTVWLNEQGFDVNTKRVARLMRVMGLQATLPGPHTSRPHPQHKIYPYLLHGMAIGGPNEVWSTDITYIPMRHGFMYLVAVMDWFSRYVIAWDLSNSMEVSFCVGALEEALRSGRPGIFNTDQDSQFTSEEFIGTLLRADVPINMDKRKFANRHHHNLPRYLSKDGGKLKFLHPAIARYSCSSVLSCALPSCILVIPNKFCEKTKDVSLYFNR